jgi:two-component system sensor histidine kinase RegB
MVSPALPSLIQRELPDHAWRLIYLRYFGAAAIVLGVVILIQSMGAALNPLPLYGIAAALVMVNLLYGLHLSRATDPAGKASAEAASRSLQLQLMTDLFLLTLLLHFSGGVSNPLMVLYIVPVVLAGFLLSCRITYVVTAFAAVCYGGMALLEYRRIIPHIGVPGLFWPGAYHNEPYLLVLMAIFILAAILSAGLSAMISGRLRIETMGRAGSGVEEELTR